MAQARRSTPEERDVTAAVAKVGPAVFAHAVRAYGAALSQGLEQAKRLAAVVEKEASARTR